MRTDKKGTYNNQRRKCSKQESIYCCPQFPVVYFRIDAKQRLPPSTHKVLVERWDNMCIPAGEKGIEYIDMSASKSSADMLVRSVKITRGVSRVRENCTCGASPNWLTGVHHTSSKFPLHKKYHRDTRLTNVTVYPFSSWPKVERYIRITHLHMTSGSTVLSIFFLTAL
jgi:hypothetical protein